MPSGKKATPEQVGTYRRLRQEGYTQAEACRRVGLSADWGRVQDKKLPTPHTRASEAMKVVRESAGPIAYENLGSEARRAFDDFEFFGRRYFGRIYKPWQLDTAEKVVEWLKEPSRTFVVENLPPGAGKTTLAHDIACWVTVRNRRIRGCFGSRAENNARRQLRRVRRSLERTTPFRASAEDIQRGLAVDAEACMAWDFGLFRPEVNDIWRADEFIVAQHDDIPIEEKEPTWSSYGMDSGVLGNRFDFIVWDDVVDKRTIRTSEAIENQRNWWDEEAETRLEPGGLLWLIGQRLSADDLYRYVLDKRVDVDAELDEVIPEEELNPDEDDRPRLYRHVVWRAHDEQKCGGKEAHRRDAGAQPEGCLLDPHRLPYRELAAIRSNNPHRFSVTYQQEDTDPDDVLVPKAWIYGGTDRDGSQLPGCMTSRDLCEPLPAGLVGRKVSIATVDPSGTKMWALQWWVSSDPNGDVPQHFLMDLERKAMQADELLDWKADEQAFTGWMEDWQQRSVRLGYPITHWVVEVNAAQRYLLAYDHVRRWQAKHRVNIVPHVTGPRKLDEDWGPTIIRNPYRYGQIRLPGSQRPGSLARVKTMKLVHELTRWPHSATDDQVMANWFHQLHLPRIAVPQDSNVRQWRPSWMAG